MKDRTLEPEGTKMLTLEVEALEERIAPGLVIGGGVEIGVSGGVSVGGNDDDDHHDG
jgi:hypothetical protein